MRKKRYSIISVVVIVVVFTEIITEAYCVKFRSKKFVETIFIRLEIMSGRLVVFVINFVVMIKVSVVFWLNLVRLVS